MTATNADIQQVTQASRGARRPYVAPTLTLFGQVAALTQSASLCTDDNSTCQPPATNMGPNVKPSDRRLKDNIVRVGTHPLGFGLYLFDYTPQEQARGGAGRQFGVMADEVQAVVPAAVTRREDGMFQVDYGLLGIRQPLH